MNGMGSGREARRYAEQVSSQHRWERGELTARDPQEFRIDLERIRFSSYFARLSDVTQVLPQTGVGPVMHNRLTHSLKVSAVARVIAAQLAGHQAQHDAFARGERTDDDAVGAVISRLGGCDTIVAQAAAHAHDLGHPPFGHLGEQVLDRVARDRLGLPEGFEGNAQSFRILTRLDTLGREFPGLNLTAATRAATLKYPWTRARWIGVTESECPPEARPRGVGTDPLAGAEKFSAYALDAVEMEQALAAFPRIAEGEQTVECAVMDLADDIAYAVHDLDDFARAGVLQRAAVGAELRAWLAGAAALGTLSEQELAAGRRDPGYSVELLWRRLDAKDDWIADRDAFADAVQRVRFEMEEVLLAAPYDGGIASERAVATFTRQWIEHLRDSIVVTDRPHVRGGYVQLDQQAWHEVMVLKFVHAHFVLERPEHAQSQRGQGRVIEELTLAFDAWLSDPRDAGRAPRRLLEWVEEATEETFALRRDRPELLVGAGAGVGAGDADCGAVATGAAGALPDDASVRRQGRARAILDYVASFSDQQAITAHRDLTRG